MAGRLQQTANRSEKIGDVDLSNTCVKYDCLNIHSSFLQFDMLSHLKGCKGSVLVKIALFDCSLASVNSCNRWQITPYLLVSMHWMLFFFNFNIFSFAVKHNFKRMIRKQDFPNASSNIEELWILSGVTLVLQSLLWFEILNLTFCCKNNS